MSTTTQSRVSSETARKGCLVSARAAALRRQERFEEARHLMGFGISPEEIARQLGTTVAGLTRTAERHKAMDIASYMRPVARRVCPQCGGPRGPRSKVCWHCRYPYSMAYPK